MIAGFPYWLIACFFIPFCLLYAIACYMHHASQIDRFLKVRFNDKSETTTLNAPLPFGVKLNIQEAEMDYEDKALQIIKTGDRAVIEKIFQSELALRQCNHQHFNLNVFNSCIEWLSEHDFHTLNQIVPAIVH